MVDKVTGYNPQEKTLAESLILNSATYFLNKHGVDEHNFTESWGRKAAYFGSGFPIDWLTKEEKEFVDKE